MQGSTEDQVRALYDRGQWAEAARTAAAAPVQTATLVFYRGLALARLNELTEAAELFRAGFRRYPRDARFALELAGVAYREKDGGGAKRYLHRALKITPGDKYGNDFLATLYLMDGNVPAALKYWNRVGKPFIGRLSFAPDPPLTPELRERSFDISAGQLFTTDRLRVTEANRARMDVLTELAFELTPEAAAAGKAEERFDLTLRTSGRNEIFGGWMGDVLPMLRGLPYETVDVDFYNIGERGLNFTSLERWDTNKRRLAFAVAAPVHLNPRVEYRYFADLRDETWDLRGTYRGAALNGVRLRRAEAGADYEIGLSDRLQWTIGGRVSDRWIANGPANAFFANGWTAAITNRFDYLLWSWPEERVTVRSWGELDAGRVFTSASSRLVTARAAGEATWLPGAKGDTYRMEERAETGRTFGNVPVDELFSLGMERDNPDDLWFRGDVGTRNGRKGGAPMGREFGISQLDFQRKMFEIPFLRLDAGPFLDAARVTDASGQFGSGQFGRAGWMTATGAEADLKTTGGVRVRFVYGRNLQNGTGVFYTSVSR